VKPRSDSGFSLVALVASITVMLILMGMAVPTWRYVMKNDREEELYFRGDQIARAIERYQRKNGNALPVSMEVLVKGHYLRKAYVDPMTENGKWRIVHPGEAVLPGPGQPGAPRPGASPSPGPSVSRGASGGGIAASAGAPGQTQGAILGVASTSKEKSLRLLNGRTRYDQWLFLAGQPRLLGRDQGVRPLPGGLGPTPSPSALPRP
jgi:type II secretory pathway pseudopilin PulG